MMKAVAFTLLGISVIGGIAAYTQGVDSLASFEAGFLGFAFIVGSSFYSLLKRIKHKENKASDTQDTQEEDTQDNIGFSVRLVVGAQVSLSFLRLFGYILFAFIVFLLLKYQLMSLAWFFIGLVVAMIAFVIIGIAIMRSKGALHL